MRPSFHERAVADERFRRHPDQPGVAGEDPVLVARRGDQAGDDQLPDVQAGARRAVLRQDLRPGHRLGVPLRQVQAHEAPRRDLRQVRRRGDPGQGAPRAAGPHRAGDAGEPRLVLQGAAEPHRPPARHLAARARAHPLLRGVRGRRSGRHRPAGRTSSSPRSSTARRARSTGHKFKAQMGAEAIKELLKPRQRRTARRSRCATGCAPRPRRRRS